MLLFSQPVLSQKSMDELKKRISTNLHDFVDRYGRDSQGADKYRILTNWKSVVDNINSLEYSVGRAVKIQTVKSWANTFSESLGKVNCTLKASIPCGNLKKTIRKDFDEYYNSARKEYSF